MTDVAEPVGPLNQPGEAPVLPRTPNRMVRKNPFMTGEEWCMFMPGQSSGVKPTHSDTNPADDLPNVWKPPGSLLRVPKCVFLTSVPPAHLWGDHFTLMTKWVAYGYFGHWNDSVARDVRTTAASSAAFGSLVFDGFVGTFSYIGWTIDPHYDPSMDAPRKWSKIGNIPNVSFAEHNRLMAVYTEVKETLETMYPGQIFIYIPEFFPKNPVRAFGPNDENMPLILDIVSPDGIAANTPKNWANGPLWILGPDAIEDVSQFQVPPSAKFQADFFGTNFLHIYAGYQCADGQAGHFGSRSGPDINDVTGRRFWNNVTSFGDPLDKGIEASLIGYTSWEAATSAPLDGYEGQSFTDMLNFMDDIGFRTEGVDGPVRTIPVGKGALLKAAFNNFAGYKCALFEYDGSYSGSYTGIEPGQGNSDKTIYHGITNFKVQDWVEDFRFNIEQVIIDTPNPYGDIHYEPGDPDYNVYIRYPSTPQMKVFTDFADLQYATMLNTLNDLGPKTVEMWSTMISTHNLGDYGFEYVGGSSMLTVEYLLDYIQRHFGFIH